MIANLTTGAAFVDELLQQNEPIMSKLDADPGPGTASNMGALIKAALKNEMEAADVAALWVASAPEIDVKLALAQHAGDEARHYVLVADKAQKMGLDLTGFDPLDPPSPVLEFLRTLNASVERVAAALVTREAMGARRNIQFLKFLEANKYDGLVKLYRDIINPDEERHHRIGCELLAKLATTAEDQQRARSAASRLLEIGDRMRDGFLQKTGASVMPGC